MALGQIIPGIGCQVGVAVSVGVGLGSGVGVCVGVGVTVAVAVAVGVGLAVAVGVAVAVAVGVGVGSGLKSVHAESISSVSSRMIFLTNIILWAGTNRRPGCVRFRWQVILGIPIAAGVIAGDARGAISAGILAVFILALHVLSTQRAVEGIAVAG